MLLLMACAGSTPGDSASEPLPLFDAHIHLPGQEGDELLDLAEAGGFKGLFVLGPASSASLASAEDPVHGFVFLENNDDAELVLTPGLLSSVRERLERGAAGIGELSIAHYGGGDPSGSAANEADDEGLLALYDLAGEFNAPVIAHLDYSETTHEAWQAALAHNRDTRFVWAHAGDTGPEVVRAHLEAHPNLQVDLSCRNPVEAFAHRPYSEEEMSIAELDRETLKPEWAALLEDHPERFLFGSDIGPGDRNEAVEDIAAFYRRMLGQLSPEAAAAIGHDNAVALVE